MFTIGIFICVLLGIGIFICLLLGYLYVYYWDIYMFTIRIFICLPLGYLYIHLILWIIKCIAQHGEITVILLWIFIYIYQKSI